MMMCLGHRHVLQRAVLHLLGRADPASPRRRTLVASRKTRARRLSGTEFRHQPWGVGYTSKPAIFRASDKRYSKHQQIFHEISMS